MVIVPKYRRKEFYGKLRRRIGELMRELCRQKEIGLVEGNAMPDHIHMLLSIPPRYSVAMTMGYLKGKSAVCVPAKSARLSAHTQSSAVSIGSQVNSVYGHLPFSPLFRHNMRVSI